MSGGDVSGGDVSGVDAVDVRLGARTSPASGIRGAWVILPTGSCEAHGPHLPLDTDCRISEEMAVRAARWLIGTGRPAVVLPTLPYGVTCYAGDFPGTLSVSAAIVTDLVHTLLGTALDVGAAGVVIANSHFEPAHIDALFAAAALLRQRDGARVVYPNVASRRHASRLGAEFASGACHAGAYETSLVLAMAPRLVDEPVRAGLPEVPVDLAAAMRAGAQTFTQAGGPRAYFGAPAAGTVADGERWLDELAAILVEAVLEGGG